MDSFCPAPLVPESQAARATASACLARGVFLNPGPGFQLAWYRPPWPTRARLRLPLPNLQEQVSRPVLPLAALPQGYRKPQVAERNWLAILRPFSCYSRG